MGQVPCRACWSEHHLINRVLFIGLMLLVVLSPLPLGSNREWSWSLCALVAALLSMGWAAANLGKRGQVSRLLHPAITVMFLLACAWALVQITPWAPESWKHPLWAMTSETLDSSLPGSISLAADDTWSALMRLLSYALVFVLAYQLGRDRARAQSVFGWLAIAGLVYGLFGLFVYWSGYHLEWLFGNKVLPHDVRSTFINRNHFATWQGLTMLCTMAWFYHRMARPVVMPYAVPQDREAKVEEFILRAWKPPDGLAVDGDRVGADPFPRWIHSHPGRHGGAIASVGSTPYVITRYVASDGNRGAGGGQHRILSHQRDAA